MKKAQVLSALALAFALGVATPLASVANAFEVTNDQNGSAAGTATCEELNKAIASVQKDANYQWYVDLKDANDKYNDGTYRDIANGGAFNYYFQTAQMPNVKSGSLNTANANAAEKFQNALNAVAAGVQLKDENGATVNVNSIAYARNALEQVKNLPYAAEFIALNNALNGSGDLATAVNTFRANVPGGDLLESDPNEYHTIDVAAVEAIYGTGILGWYNSVNYQTSALDAAYEKATAGKAAYEALLNQAGVLSESGAAEVESVDKDTNPTVVMNLQYVTANNNGEIAINSNWYANYDKITGMAPCDETTLESTNFDNLWTIATNYKKATDQTSVNTKDIAEALIGGATTPARVNQISSADGLIRIDAIEGDFAKGTVIRYDITDATLEGESYKNVKEQIILDIWLEDADGNEIEIKDQRIKVTVNRALLGDVDTATAVVYYVVPGNDIDDQYTEIADIESLPAHGNENEVVFETTHFSLYAFVNYGSEDDNKKPVEVKPVEDDKKNEGLNKGLEVKAPNTGATANTSATTTKATTSVAAVVVAAVAAILAAFGIARKANRK